MAGGLGALRRLLIANRGEIARRVARTARALGVEDVRVWSQADSHGPHAVEARRGANLGGASAAESYLQVRGWAVSLDRKKGHTWCGAKAPLGFDILPFLT